MKEIWEIVLVAGAGMAKNDLSRKQKSRFFPTLNQPKTRGTSKVLTATESRECQEQESH